MKTTIDISDDLLLRAKKMASDKKTTLRNLIERALTDVLDQQEEQVEVKLVTKKGKGLNPDFAGKSWDSLLGEIY